MTQTQISLFFAMPVLVGMLLSATPIITENAYAENSFDIILDVSESTKGISASSQISAQQEYAPGYVFIKFKEEPTIKSQSTAESSTQNRLMATSLESFDSIDAKLIKLKDLSVLEAIELYKNHPQIEYIEPDYVVSINAIPNDPHYPHLWGMDKINAPKAWDLTQGTDVMVAVLDTGVDYTHDDLASNMWVNQGEIPNNGVDDDGNGYVDDIHGYDFVNNDGDPFDDHYHGTHVAGTIAAVGNNNLGVIGVNPKAQIVAIKFIDSLGYGYVSEAISAINYSVAVGAKISSNSWGVDVYSTPLYNAIANAYESGQVFVTTASNNGANLDVYPFYPASYNLNNIISVASTSSNDTLSWFSNYGVLSVDLGAPGSNIYSTMPNNSYLYVTGTSMAAPPVSGVLSLMLSVDPNLSVTDMKQKLLGSTNQVSYLNGITVSGGLLDACEAVSSVMVGNPLCYTPTQWNGKLVPIP